MGKDRNQVLIERGSGEQARAGSVTFRAQYHGADVTLIVSAAVLDGFNTPQDRDVSAEEWSDGTYAAIEEAATRKARKQKGAWDTLDIDVHDLR